MIARLVLLAGSLLVAPVSALAQVPASVSLAVEPCAEGTVDALAITDAVRVELASDGISDVHAAILEDEIAAVRIAEACSDRGSFVVHIDDLVTHKSVERVVTLEGLPASAVPRALALAVAELLRASWAELELVDEPASAPPIVEALRVRVRGLRDGRSLGAPPAPPVVEPVPDPVAASPPRVEIAAEGVVRSFPGGGASPVGGRLVVDLPVDPSVALRLEGEVVFGTSLHPLGVIDLGLATGGVTLAYAVPLDVVRWEIGARIAGGIAWTQGRASSALATGTSSDGFVLLVGGLLGLTVPIAEIVALRFDVEGGGAAVGFQARVDLTPVAGLVGGYLAVAGGVALRL